MCVHTILPSNQFDTWMWNDKCCIIRNMMTKRSIFAPHSMYIFVYNTHIQLLLLTQSETNLKQRHMTMKDKIIFKQFYLFAMTLWKWNSKNAIFQTLLHSFAFKNTLILCMYIFTYLWFNWNRRLQYKIADLCTWY